MLPYISYIFHTLKSQVKKKVFICLSDSGEEMNCKKINDYILFVAAVHNYEGEKLKVWEIHYLNYLQYMKSRFCEF